MNKKILLGAIDSIIEPLALFHLSTIAKEEGWEAKIVLSKGPKFEKWEKALEEFKPDLFGATIYTGNHIELGEYFNKIRLKYPDMKIISGGPHATYFPLDAKKYADFVVVSEGFKSFRNILRGELKPGIIHLKEREPFPISDRESFYSENPQYLKNQIKNIITHTGCPYACTYCYNSSTLDFIEPALNKTQLNEMENNLAKNKRLFPNCNRSVDDVIKEIDDIIKIAPGTELLYIQDDIFGMDIKWLREFASKYKNRLKYHAQLRFEFINPDKDECRERIDLMLKTGCTGLTMAIESADPVIREEVLNRHMTNDLMFNAMKYLSQFDLTVRTEQMLGLPTGATTKETKINLDADLENLKLNVELKEATGLPTVAWASTLAPYRGTIIEGYCQKHGFYSGNNSDISSEGYRMRSVLRFPKKWTGPSLRLQTDDWLAREDQERYKDQLHILMDWFSIFASIKKGHLLAKELLNDPNISYHPEYHLVSRYTRYHLYNYELFKIKQ